MTAISQRKEFKRCFAKYPLRMRERRYLNPWNSKENHFRFHPCFVRKFPLKLLNYAVSSSQSSDFRARSLLNFFTRWVKKFCSPLNVKLEFSECDKLLSGGCKWDLRTKQCKMSMWFYDEFHGFRRYISFWTMSDIKNASLLRNWLDSLALHSIISHPIAPTLTW